MAPRAGVAWDVSGDGRTAVRASYGLGYDFQSASYLFISATAPPYAEPHQGERPGWRFR